MNREDYEARWVEAYNRAKSDHERKAIQKDRLTYPKSTRNAIMEIKERGFDPDSGRLHRWVDSRPEGEAPPKAPGVRGTTLAWEREHIDALIQHLEGLKSFTDEEVIRRNFGISQTQIEDAMEASAKKVAKAGGEPCGFYGLFFWDGKLTAIPLDRPMVDPPKRPLGMFVTIQNLLAPDMSSFNRLSKVMQSVFTDGHLPDLEGED